MRWCPALLLLAAIASAQQPKKQDDPFAPLDIKFQARLSVPGTKARVGEAIARLKQALEKHPADIDALERAMPLLQRIDRVRTLPLLDRALKVPGLNATVVARLRSLRGRSRAGSFEPLRGLVFPGNINARALDRIRKMLEGMGGQVANSARPDLEAAVKALPNDWRARLALARLLEAIDSEKRKDTDKKHAEQIKRLRAEAAALVLREQGRIPAPIERLAEIAQLREHAEALEQLKDGPKHADALELRRRALILDFCSYTIAFDAARLWEEVALLAPEHMVQENLTRTFVTKKGEISSVAVQYYRPPIRKQLGVIAALGKDAGDTAAAALLAVLRRSRDESPLSDAALLAARQKAVVDGLPKLLATALFSHDGVEYPRYGRRYLVALAGELALKTAAPVLRKALAIDNDLWIPLGVAESLGRIGRAEDADALLSAARNIARAVHFRREATVALGRIAPDRLAALENVRELEIAVAAARYRAKPNASDLGRILAGLDRMHEADDAAEYCADLRIREALPAMETYLDERAEHYAVESVRRAHERLVASLRGG